MARMSCSVTSPSIHLETRRTFFQWRSSSHCSRRLSVNPRGITLEFVDDEAFAYAQKVWDWVNGADDHSFLMVAGAGDCGDNPHRVPYLVHSIQYDEAANTARLDATTDEWKNLVHSYELRVGRVTPQPGIKLRRKDGDDSTAFSVTKAFPFEVKVEAGPVAGKLECDDCELSGSLNVNMHVTFGLPDIIDKAVFRLEPKGIKAQAHPKLTLGAQFKKEVVLKKSALPQPIPLYAITLGGFMRLGAFTEVVIGVEATGFEGTIAVESGATATVPDTAFVEVDFKNLDGGIKRSSWVPKVDVAPVTISGQMSTKVQVFVAPALKLEASALGRLHQQTRLLFFGQWLTC